MGTRRKDPYQLAEEASKVFSAQAEEAQRELNKMAEELSGVDITPKSWITPNREVLENATKKEAQGETTTQAENGIDYGIVILPPIDGDTNPEMESYPADYVEYARDRLREHKREHGELPKWERGTTGKDESETVAEEYRP